jgi:hypothetical protein
MATSSTTPAPITATVPNKLVGDHHRSDLLLVGLLKAAGIPAVSVNPGWKFGIQTSTPGTLTSIPGKETTVFTWVPTPVPPTAEETQIAALQANATSASATITTMTAELATANAEITSLKEDIADTDSDNALLTKQLAAANAQITTMTAELATANATIATLQAQIASVESNLKAATAGLGGAPAPSPTPAA